MNNDTVTVRYTGTDTKRMYVIQRGDLTFWTGEGFHPSLDMAKVFYLHKTAQITCEALKYDRWRGKPVRSFKLVLDIDLVADQVGDITEEKLLKFLSEAMRIDVENTTYGDGPGNSMVKARVNLNTLAEVAPKKAKF
jgi:hypothetical protein